MKPEIAFEVSDDHIDVRSMTSADLVSLRRTTSSKVYAQPSPDGTRVVQISAAEPHKVVHLFNEDEKSPGLRVGRITTKVEMLFMLEDMYRGEATYALKFWRGSPFELVRPQLELRISIRRTETGFAMDVVHHGFRLSRAFSAQSPVKSLDLQFKSRREFLIFVQPTRGAERVVRVDLVESTFDQAIDWVILK